MTDHSRTRSLLAQLPPSGTPLTIQVVRELRAEDLETPTHAPVKTLRQLRHSHHQLARLLAKGTPDVEASLITGYALPTISNLKINEAFRELLAHYAVVDTQAEADIRGQMTSVGQLALSELGRRLEDGAEEFSVTQLHGTIDLLLTQPAKGTQAPPSQMPTFQVNFVAPSGEAAPKARVEIDGELADAAPFDANGVFRR